MKEDLTTILHEHGYKVTPPRLAILSVFDIHCSPLNAEKVYAKVKKTGVDMVTVYRTLTLFEKSGILRQVHISNDAVYYERTLDDHHHIICTRCNKISDFTGCESHALIEKALKQATDFKLVSQHSFDLFGVCKSCATT